MLKPKSVDLYLVYGCPNCGAEHTATREETIFPGGVLCNCGEKIIFQPIKTITVRPNYEPENKSPAKKIDKVQSNHDDVVALLVGLGYNKLVARRRVAELSHLKDEQIIETLLKEKQ